MPWLDIGQIIISLLIFASVSTLVWAVFARPLRAATPGGQHVAVALGVARPPTAFDWPIVGQALALALALARRLPWFRPRIWQNLEASGNPNGYSVDQYLAICIAGAGGLALAAAAFLAAIRQFDPLTLLVMTAAGFFIPLWTLREAAAKRVRQIAQQLPYSLDLIALLLEAGASFSDAVETVIRDAPHEPLNQELRLVQSEMALGTARAAALQRLGQRIPLESLRSVIGAINQAEALGTPLAKILKSQAGMIRMVRSVRAEEASASASMRILIPSMLILIAVMLVVFSPIILMWIQGTLV